MGGGSGREGSIQGLPVRGEGLAGRAGVGMGNREAVGGQGGEDGGEVVV